MLTKKVSIILLLRPEIKKESTPGIIGPSIFALRSVMLSQPISFTLGNKGKDELE